MEDELAGPEARYEQRESVELAFVAALQQLPANQRAVLILREVLGFSAQEVADALDTTVASVNSALQRARKAVEERAAGAEPAGHPARARRRARSASSWSATWTPWERGDVDRRWTCSPRTPPSRCRRSRPGSAARSDPDFLPAGRCRATWRWRPIPARANGQPALAFYTWDEDERALPAVRAQRADLPRRADQRRDAFVARATDIPAASESYARWPDEPLDPAAAVRGLRELRPARAAGLSDEFRGARAGL